MHTQAEHDRFPLARVYLHVVHDIGLQLCNNKKAENVAKHKGVP